MKSLIYGFKRFILILIVCVCFRVYAHVRDVCFLYPQKTEESARSLGARLSGDCELPDSGAGN